MNLLQLKTKVWISTVMIIGNCDNGNQIRAIINYGETFTSHSKYKKQKRKRAYNKNDQSPLYNASSKYQKYVNYDNPPSPNPDTLKYTDYFFPGSRRIYDLPIWDWFLADVKDDSDIDKLGRDIKDIKIHINLLNLEGDEYFIDTKNIDEQINKFAQTGIDNALSSFMLILLKSEIDNNPLNRDLILQRLYEYFFAYFGIYKFSKEYMLLFFMFKKRFTNFWRKKVTLKQLTVTKDLSRIRKDFCKVEKIYALIESVVMESQPPYKATMLMLYFNFMKLPSSLKDKYINLYFRDEDLLISRLVDSVIQSNNKQFNQIHNF